MIRIFAGAGEASGDLILAALLRGLRESLPPGSIEVRGFGGPLSEAQGLRSAFPLKDLAVNGFQDVLRRALFLARAYRRLRAQLATFRPDLVLLVDYPGMNIGLARRAQALGIPVHYVAPPQLWAYRDPEPRLRRLRAALTGASLQVLFPFEGAPYAPWAARLRQGHFFPAPAFEPARGTRLLLCPGSRRGVMRRNLPLWLGRVRAFFGTLEGVDVLVPGFLAEEARRFSGGARVLTDKEDAFSSAGAAIAFPGTLTLELFLRRIPARAWAVLDPLTLRIGRSQLRGPHLCLPNVLAERELLPEWTGTIRDFRKHPPALPEKIGDWNPADAGDFVATVWAKMGSNQGATEGVAACGEILRGR